MLRLVERNTYVHVCPCECQLSFMVLASKVQICWMVLSLVAVFTFLFFIVFHNLFQYKLSLLSP
jgi:hypothetical protein